jgi:RNA polymerase sigma-70 factor (ECF subfamily)
MEPVEFGSLYERYAPDVLRFALYLTGSRAEAEDITSETFVRAWVESDAIRVGTVKAYLFMIARNLHVDWRRREARRGELAREPADPAPGPDVESEGRNELRVVLAALQQLPEVDRAALLMRMDEMSYDAVAAALGLSTVAVRVKVHRARMKLHELREALQEDR